AKAPPAFSASSHRTSPKSRSKSSQVIGLAAPHGWHDRSRATAEGRVRSSLGQLAGLAAGVRRVEREALAHRPGEAEGAEVERVVAGLAARDGDQELLGMAREGDDVALDVAALLELRPVRAVPALDRRARPLEEHLLHAGHVDAVARDLVREVGAEEGLFASRRVVSSGTCGLPRRSASAAYLFGRQSPRADKPEPPAG